MIEMPILKHPVKEYLVSGTCMTNSGMYAGFDVILRLDRATEEQVQELEAFLRMRGWVR